MNDINVTRVSRTARGVTSGAADHDVALADSNQVAHERIVRTVRWLLENTEVSQRDLAELLECDVSSVNRALLVVDRGPRQRRRDWRAREVFRLSLFFDLPVEVFYGTNVEEVWAQRMEAARAEHRALLESLGENDE
jgi:hypothetical protein